MMTAGTPDNLAGTPHDKARDKIRRTVSRMIEGSGLHMQEFPHELVITNPQGNWSGPFACGVTVRG
jgi:hypothetical protein